MGPLRIVAGMSDKLYSVNWGYRKCENTQNKVFLHCCSSSLWLRLAFWHFGAGDAVLLLVEAQLVETVSALYAVDLFVSASVTLHGVVSN